MNFDSDNIAAINPEIMQLMYDINHGYAAPYGTDELTTIVKQRIRETFEHADAEVYFTSTGTAANVLALSAITSSNGLIFCHEQSHVVKDEEAAVKFHTNGARLVLIRGYPGKIDCSELETMIKKTMHRRHNTKRLCAISLAQSTEAGTIYTALELHKIVNIAKNYGLYVHMDGARFANALVSHGGSPADITWKVGIDVLSLGLTKNGAFAAEAIIFFNKKILKGFKLNYMRSGHMMAKMRFISAQFYASFDGDLWLKNARNANYMAQLLCNVLQSIPMAKIIYPVEANEIFIKIPSSLVLYLKKRGVGFRSWGKKNLSHYRFVTSWLTTEKDIQKFCKIIKKFKSQ